MHWGTRSGNVMTNTMFGWLTACQRCSDVRVFLQDAPEVVLRRASVIELNALLAARMQRSGR